MRHFHQILLLGTNLSLKNMQIDLVPYIPKNRKKLFYSVLTSTSLVQLLSTVVLHYFIIKKGQTHNNWTRCILLGQQYLTSWASLIIVNLLKLNSSIFQIRLEVCQLIENVLIHKYILISTKFNLKRKQWSQRTKCSKTKKKVEVQSFIGNHS